MAVTKILQRTIYKNLQWKFPACILICSTMASFDLPCYCSSRKYCPRPARREKLKRYRAVIKGISQVTFETLLTPSFLRTGRFRCNCDDRVSFRREWNANCTPEYDSAADTSRNWQLWLREISWASDTETVLGEKERENLIIVKNNFLGTVHKLSHMK